jgi:GH25 family lysozyme M1 (1,4-beta-N-acetylmuramidase)
MTKRLLTSIFALISLLLATFILAPPVSAAPNGSSDCTTWVRGIDVSNWQGNIDWSQVPSSGVAYAWSKTTEGTWYVDPTWVPNAVGATNAGIPWGGYHYARPDATSGAVQAQYFVSKGGMSGTLPGMLDLEETGGLNPDELGQWAQDFLNTAQALSGKRPIIYVGAYFPVNLDYVAYWPHYYPLMLPSYTAGYEENVNPCWINTPRTPDSYVNNGTGWDVWQYSSSGLVAGIGGHVDMNVMTPEFFQQITGIGTTPAPVPVPEQPDNAPWQVYKIGSKGPGVVKIQSLLNNAGLNAGPADGIFGQQTANAVARWQQILGITADGIWGAQTQQSTDDFFLWLNSVGIVPPAPDPNPALEFINNCVTNVFSQGSTGACVTLAQTLEANKGYWIATDGIFGGFTTTVTRDFQWRNGLVADGIVGPATWRSLFS